MASFAKDASWSCQFPISLAVKGEACFARIAQAGIGRTLFCAMIYAPYRLVLPRYPQRGIYSLEEGRYHYRLDEMPGLVRAIRRGGAIGVGYFCYGLMTRERLEAIRVGNGC